jgi:hypothetical protein
MYFTFRYETKSITSEIDTSCVLLMFGVKYISLEISVEILY